MPAAMHRDTIKGTPVVPRNGTTQQTVRVMLVGTTRGVTYPIFCVISPYTCMARNKILMFNAWLTIHNTVAYAIEREVNCCPVCNSRGNDFSDSLLGSCKLPRRDWYVNTASQRNKWKGWGAWRPLSLAVISSVIHTHTHTGKVTEVNHAIMTYEGVETELHAFLTSVLSESGQVPAVILSPPPQCPLVGERCLLYYVFIN